MTASKRRDVGEDKGTRAKGRAGTGTAARRAGAAYVLRRPRIRQASSMLIATVE
jgi:hypothetical protein